MTTIYLTHINDRHVDSQTYPFSTPELAIAFAQKVLDVNKESAKYVDDDELFMSENQLKAAGWLFYGCYSPEGDCVWVDSKELYSGSFPLDSGVYP